MFKFVELGIEKLREQQQQLKLELEQKKREAGRERLRLGAFGATAGGVLGLAVSAIPEAALIAAGPVGWGIGLGGGALGALVGVKRQAKQREIEVLERELPRLRKIESR